MKKFSETKFGAGWAKLRQDLKPMTFRQKVDHLWTYYKVFIFIILFLCSPLFLLGTFLNRQGQEVLVSGMMVNLQVDPKLMTYMTTDYALDLGATSEKQIAELDYANFGDLFDSQNAEGNYNQMMMLVARVSAGTLDYMLLDQKAMEHYIAQQVYLDLREFFTPQELEALNAEGKVIYARQEDQEDKWAVAVDISDTAFVKDNVNSEGPVYFALSGNYQRPEICRNAWERIQNWPGK